MKSRICYSLFLAILLVTLSFGSVPSAAVSAAPGSSQAVDEVDYVPGQLSVGLSRSISLFDRTARAKGVAISVGARIVRIGANGYVLLDIGKDQSVPDVALRVKKMRGVRYAEPNYIYKIAEPDPADLITAEGEQPAAEMGTAAIPTVPPVYPNDPSLWQNGGWARVAADIVWKNTTASKGVCLLDTGVDYLHKDLAAKIIKGYDYVNNDLDPMDDHGNGTHLAGIIAAIGNNNEGIAGVSTGKVVAVKVINVYGVGEAYEIAQGVRACADNTSVSILSIGWTGRDTQTLKDAINYAVNVKGKLVVAAAVNSNTNDPTNSYPAAYSTLYVGKVVAVAAGGRGNGTNPDYACKASNSAYGSWITLTAPGTRIYSTTPWDRNFQLWANGNAQLRYSNLSGTAQAAAFVAATAARAWGYQPALNAAGVTTRLQTTGVPLSSNVNCWPSGMTAKEVNVASALDRGAVQLMVLDAGTGLPLSGAVVSVYSVTGSVLAGSGTVPYLSAYDPRQRSVQKAPSFTEVLNIPAKGPTMYYAKASAVNYTASPQKAFVGMKASGFQDDGSFQVIPGFYTYDGYAYLPPKSANIFVGAASPNDTSSYEPALLVYLPDPPKFITSFYFSSNNSASWADVLPYGTLMGPPYARAMVVDNFYESVALQKRSTNAAAPWYPGVYQVGINDYPNVSTDPNYLDSENVSALVWKDGVVKLRVDKGVPCTNTNHYWFPLTINSPVSGAATFIKNTVDPCRAAGPY